MILGAFLAISLLALAEACIQPFMIDSQKSKISAFTGKARQHIGSIPLDTEIRLANEELQTGYEGSIFVEYLGPCVNTPYQLLGKMEGAKLYYREPRSSVKICPQVVQTLVYPPGVDKATAQVDMQDMEVSLTSDKLELNEGGSYNSTFYISTLGGSSTTRQLITFVGLDLNDQVTSISAGTVAPFQGELVVRRQGFEVQLSLNMDYDLPLIPPSESATSGQATYFIKSHLFARAKF